MFSSLFYLFSVYVSLKGRCLAPPTPPDNASTSDNVPFYDAIGEHDDDQNFDHLQRPSPATVAALASALPNIYSPYEMSGQQPPSIEKYVNPLGTVTTITAGMTTEVQTDILDEVVSQLAAEDTVIHENCDEALFRPVVAIFCDEETRKRVEQEEENRSQSELCKPPEHIPNKLVVPVIAKEVDDEMCKRAKAQQTEKTRQKLLANEKTEQAKFAELASLNKKSKPTEDKKINTKNVKTVVDTKKKTETQSREKQETEEKPIEFKRMTPLANEKKETFKGNKNNTIDQTAKMNVPATNKPTKINNKKSIDKETLKGEDDLDLKQDKDKKMTQIKTEHLNISDLADSLIELKVEVEEEEIAQKEEVKKEVEANLVTVDIYAEENVAQEEEEKAEENTKRDMEISSKDMQENSKSEEKEEIKLEETDKTDNEVVKAASKTVHKNKKAEVEKQQDMKDMNESVKLEVEENKYKVKVIESELPIRKDNKQKGTEVAAKIEKKAVVKDEEFKVKVTEILNKKKDTQVNNSPTKKQQALSKNKDTTDSKVITQQPLKNKNSLPSTDEAEDKVVEENTAKTSAWKNLSGAEMINKTLEKPAEKIIDIPTPTKSNKKGKKSFVSDFEDFPMLKPLEALPPLPALEPLELLEPQVVDETIANALPNLSLINFESPSQETSNVMRKATTPRGLPDQNLIYALCGSLHYENETADKTEVCSPTLSLTRSSSVLGEHSTAEYKSLTENDEQYVSLEFSSQDTHTTNTNTTTNEKLTSSSNASSASEEVVSLEEKKMSKRQKRKLLKSKKEAAAVALLKSSEQPQQELDEELRPLIDNMGSGLSDSQADSAGEQYMTTFRAPLPVPRQTVNNNTTDSEGPLPCTTSDDNIVYTYASDANSPVICAPHKIKTKKLEHKINLIAAIEAATSSSTSSAEESGVEAIEGRRRSLELDGAALVSLATSVGAMPLLSAPIVSVPAPTINSVAASGIASSGTNGGAKKKTKRRKR